VAAWVPASHEWLRNRPLGKVLISALGKHDFQLLFMYVPADQVYGILFLIIFHSFINFALTFCLHYLVLCVWIFSLTSFCRWSIFQPVKFQLLKPCDR